MVIWVCYSFNTGGDLIYEVIKIIFSTLISFYLCSIIFIKLKSRCYFHSKKSEFYLEIFLKNIPQNNICNFLFNNLKNKLQEISELDLPFGIAVKKYIFIKYFLSFLVLFISYLKNNNIFISIISFSVIFYVLDVLIAIYKNNEKLEIILDIQRIVESQILSLSINLSFKNALKISMQTVQNNRLKQLLVKMYEYYVLRNYNIEKSIGLIENKFNIYELEIYLSILKKSKIEGNLLNSLELFSSSLETNYYKNLKILNMKGGVLVSITTLISMMNIFLIVFYPIIVQIKQGIIQMFSS